MAGASILSYPTIENYNALFYLLQVSLDTLDWGELIILSTRSIWKVLVIVH